MPAASFVDKKIKENATLGTKLHGTGPARLINTTDMPPVVFFNVSAHVFFGKTPGGKNKNLENQSKTVERNKDMGK